MLRGHPVAAELAKLPTQSPLFVAASSALRCAKHTPECALPLCTFLAEATILFMGKGIPVGRWRRGRQSDCEAMLVSPRVFRDDVGKWRSRTVERSRGQSDCDAEVDL